MGARQLNAGDDDSVDNDDTENSDDKDGSMGGWNSQAESLSDIGAKTMPRGHRQTSNLYLRFTTTSQLQIMPLS